MYDTMAQDIITNQNPLNPTLSFSSKPPSEKTTFVQKLLSVRIILIATCTFQVIMLCAVMYAFTYYSEHQITNDLSDKILRSAIYTAADATTDRFSLPYFMGVGAAAWLPKENITFANLKPYLWHLYKQAGGSLLDFYWSNLHGDCGGYYRSKENGVLYELYCMNYESDMYPVVDFETGASNKSEAIFLPGYNLTDYDWWQAAYNSPETPKWSRVYKDQSFPGILWLTFTRRVTDPLTNESSLFMLDITSEDLQHDFQSIEISKNVVVFLMQRADRTLVACSDPSEHTYTTPYIYSAYDSNIELVVEATKRLPKNLKTENRFDFKLHGTSINAYYKSITTYNLDFILVVAYPSSDFFGVISTTRKMLLSVSSCVFVIALASSIAVMLLITRPLTKLGKLMEEIAKGVFESNNLERPSATKLYEIHLLQQDFNRMVNALKAFGRFVPVDIVRYLLRNNAEAVVNMRQKDITVMFSDIKNFTQKVEDMPPAKLSLILSDYLNAMCSVIAETEGTVDKFIGDAIMALWNVPSAVDNHAILACSAALKSLMCLDQLNRKWNAIELPCVEVRIGIHTGKALVGNLGSQERLAYTAVGDNINLGARLESLNKKYGEVYEQAKEHFLCRYLDVVVVKGRTSHTHVYELVNYIDRTTEKQQTLCSAQADALKLFFDKKFDAALRVYDWLHAEMPDDISIMMLTERTQQAQQLGDDLPEDWTGYLILEDK